MPEEFTTEELNFIEDAINLAEQANQYTPLYDRKYLEEWEIKDRVISKIERMKIDLKAKE